MSARRALRQRLHSLGEIQEILSSMKTLAVLETRKLTRFGASQHRVVEGIERAAADLCRSFPQLLERPPLSTELYLLLGSERGFCGDFNESLVTALVSLDRDRPIANRLVLAVGSRLFPKLGHDAWLVRLNGAGATEEVPAVLGRVVDTVLDLESRFSPLGLTVLHHQLETHQVGIRRLLPSFEAFAGRPPVAAPPPHINLPLPQLFAELVDHYLFASLHELFYTALLAENQRRIQHLEAATRRLEEEVSRLALKANALRQEEITEEIEVILLSTQENIRNP